MKQSDIKEPVTSLELSKKLKELGVKQDSSFVWIGVDDKPDYPWKAQWRYEAYSNVQGWLYEKGVAAFTAGELGEMLPLQYSSRQTQHDFATGQLDKSKKKTGFVCDNLLYCVPPNNPKTFFATTEAEVRAMQLIWLIENKLVKPEEL